MSLVILGRHCLYAIFEITPSQQLLRLMTVFSFDEAQRSLMSVFNRANSDSAGTYLREV